MSAQAKPRSRFGETLRRELAQQGLSIRALARRIDPGKPEQARRSLARWIAGTTHPSPASRAIVADALGLDPSVFDNDGDDDDEMADIVRALMHRIDRKVSEEVDARLQEQL